MVEEVSKKSININNHKSTIETNDKKVFLTLGNNGAIKLGSGINLPEADDDNIIDYKGVLRYNQEMGTVEYCDGESWRTISTDDSVENNSTIMWSLLF